MDFFGRQPFFARQQDDFFMPVSRGFTNEPMFRRQKPIIDVEDYYDPIFGNGGIRRRQPCDCMNCQMERYHQQHDRKQQQRYNMQDDERVRGRKNKKAKKSKQKQEVEEQNTIKEGNETEQQILAPKIKHNVEKKMIPEESNETNQQMISEETNDTNEQMILEETSDTNIVAEQECQRHINGDDNGPTSNDEGEEGEKEEESEEERIKKNNEAKITLIEDIKNEVNELNKKVNELSTTNTKNYDYLYCEEMLTKCLLKLDDILAEGEETVRTARKNVINEINEGLQCLENKLSK